VTDGSSTTDRPLNDQGSASDRSDLGQALDQQPPTCPPGAKLVLTPGSSTLFSAAKQSFNQSCKMGNFLSSITPYTLSACPTNPTLDEVLAQALAQSPSSLDKQYGSAKTLTELQSTFFFKASSYLCLGGPQLLAVIKTHCGNTTILGWYGEVDVRCQNCTLYSTLALVYCPAVNKAVVLEGMYGYDS